MLREAQNPKQLLLFLCYLVTHKSVFMSALKKKEKNGKKGGKFISARLLKKSLCVFMSYTPQLFKNLQWPENTAHTQGQQRVFNKKMSNDCNERVILMWLTETPGSWCGSSCVCQLVCY